MLVVLALKLTAEDASFFEFYRTLTETVRKKIDILHRTASDATSREAHYEALLEEVSDESFSGEIDND
jgi:predicted CopG family antitoxin